MDGRVPCAFLALFAALALGCGPAARGGEIPVTTVDPSGPGAGPSAAKGECPRLDSALLAVAKASDPLAAARSAGLPLREGRVQVLVVLSGADVSFPSGYGAEAGKRLGAEVQAFVPPAALCGLAGDSRVLAVRVPGQALVP